MSLMIIDPYRNASTGDPFWADVISLLQFSTPGSTTTDAISPNTWTITSPANVLGVGSSNYRAAFGGYFDNSSLISNLGNLYSNTSADYALGTGDFTIDCWAYLDPALMTVVSVVFYGYNAGFTADVEVYFQGASSLRYYGNALDRINATVSIPSAGWYHIACCRASGTTRLFLDGVQVGSSYTDSLDYPITKIEWGALSFFGARIIGSMDDCRLTAAARYTGNFTPPTSSVPAF